MNQRPEDIHELIEAYLDGQLPEGERLDLERRIEADARLRAEVEVARRVSESLRRNIRPPTINVGEGPGPAGRIGPGRAVKRGLILGGLAAGVVLAGAVALHVLTLPEGSDRDRWVSLSTAEAVYRVQVEARGFEPEWVCETEEEFVEAVRDHLGRPLVLRMDEPGVEVLGWAYAEGYGRPIISNETMVLLVRVGGDPVLVFMDRAGAGRDLELSGELGLNLFRAEEGGVVLYELTPRGEPGVLGLFFVPGGGGGPG